MQSKSYVLMNSFYIPSDNSTRHTFFNMSSIMGKQLLSNKESKRKPSRYMWEVSPLQICYSACTPCEVYVELL